MGQRDLTPWTLKPLATFVLGLFVLFFTAIAFFMIGAASSLEASAVTRALVVLLALAGVGAAVSTFMWSRHWRHVQWDGNFWAFVASPPDYEEALLAWKWGRRFKACWVIMMVAMLAIPIVEETLKRLR